MKIFIANDSRQQQGGGWSWLSGFKKGMGELITTDYNEATHVLIPSASMVKPEVAEKARQDGKKVILRTDNALKHSRNQGKGMARMKRIADVSDLIIYQCQWAKDYLSDYLGNENWNVIYNGIDLDIFTSDGSKTDFGTSPVYLYSSAAKNETKRWEWAWWDYQKRQKENSDAMLVIAGRVSTPVMENGFDFFQGERYSYVGMMTTTEDMARIYRGCDYFYAVAENDCYSNSILEASMCGLELIEVNMTGGTPELLENISKGREYNGIKRMCAEYLTVISSL